MPRTGPALVEMWVPDVPVPQDSAWTCSARSARYAFVTDLAKARPLVKNPDLVAAVEEIGSDALVVWLENDWVLAALDPGDAEPERLENLLRGLGELADVIDPFDRDPDEAAGTAAEGEPSDRSEPDPSGRAETAATELTRPEPAPPSPAITRSQIGSRYAYHLVTGATSGIGRAFSIN